MNLELFAGRACELKKMNNAPILFGKIDRVSGDRMEVAGVKELLPQVACGQRVKILIYDETGGFEVLVGRVDDWEPKCLALREVVSIVEYERQHFFRVGVDLPARIYEIYDDQLYGPIPIRIKSISLNSMLFECAQTLVAEQRIEVDPSFFSIEVEHLYATVSRGQRMTNSMAYVADFDPLAEWEEQQNRGMKSAENGGRWRSDGRRGQEQGRKGYFRAGYRHAQRDRRGRRN